MPKIAPKLVLPLLVHHEPFDTLPRTALRTLCVPGWSAPTSISISVSVVSHDDETFGSVHVRTVAKPTGLPLFAMNTMSPLTPHGLPDTVSMPSVPTCVGVPLF